jgi:thermostable 8-oxoguanine DNA glycosylase
MFYISFQAIKFVISIFRSVLVARESNPNYNAAPIANSDSHYKVSFYELSLHVHTRNYSSERGPTVQATMGEHRVIYRMSDLRSSYMYHRYPDKRNCFVHLHTKSIFPRIILLLH